MVEARAHHGRAVDLVAAVMGGAPPDHKSVTAEINKLGDAASRAALSKVLPVTATGAQIFNFLWAKIASGASPDMSSFATLGNLAAAKTYENDKCGYVGGSAVQTLRARGPAAMKERAGARTPTTPRSAPPS